MNIFATSANPTQCAEFLDDKRLVKMCLETSQILSTVLNGLQGEWGGCAGGWYRTTHANHPVVLWAGQTRGNYVWTCQLYEALCAEYTARFGRVHKCADYIDRAYDGAAGVPEGSRTEFVNCTKYGHIENVHMAYILHLTAKWANDKVKPTWRKNNVISLYNPFFDSVRGDLVYDRICVELWDARRAN